MEWRSTSSDNPSDAERLGSLIVGGALVFTGLSQRSLLRNLLTVSGGSLIYHSIMGDKSLQNKLMETTTGLVANSIRVEKTVTIQNKSPEELYTFWRNFENLPTFMKKGDILGHEFMGEVVELGRKVTNVKIGDRVVVPFTISCGSCFFCSREMTSLCDNSNPDGCVYE